MLLRGIYYEAYQPAKTPSKVHSRDEFLDAVSGELNDLPPIDPEDACRSVFDCMRSHITPGQLEKVFWSLPEHVRQIFGAAESVK